MRLMSVSLFILFNIYLIQGSNSTDGVKSDGDFGSENSENVPVGADEKSDDVVYDEYEYDDGNGENSIAGKSSKEKENATEVISGSDEGFPNEVFLTLRNITADAATAFRSFTNRNDVVDLQASASDNLNVSSNSTFGDLESAGINLRALRDAGHPPVIIEESLGAVHLPYKHTKIDTADLSDCALQGEWKPIGVAHGHLHVEGDSSHQAEVLQSVGSYTVPNKVIPWQQNLGGSQGGILHHKPSGLYAGGTGGGSYGSSFGYGFGSGLGSGSAHGIGGGGGGAGGIGGASNHHYGGGSFSGGGLGQFQKIKSASMFAPPPVPPIILGKKPGYWKLPKTKHKYFPAKGRRPGFQSGGSYGFSNYASGYLNHGGSAGQSGALLSGYGSGGYGSGGYGSGGHGSGGYSILGGSSHSAHSIGGAGLGISGGSGSLSHGFRGGSKGVTSAGGATHGFQAGSGGSSISVHGYGNGGGAGGYSILSGSGHGGGIGGFSLSSGSSHGGGGYSISSSSGHSGGSGGGFSTLSGSGHSAGGGAGGYSISSISGHGGAGGGGSGGSGGYSILSGSGHGGAGGGGGGGGGYTLLGGSGHGGAGGGSGGYSILSGSGHGGAGGGGSGGGGGYSILSGSSHGGAGGGGGGGYTLLSGSGHGGAGSGGGAGGYSILSGSGHGGGGAGGYSLSESSGHDGGAGGYSVISESGHGGGAGGAEGYSLSISSGHGGEEEEAGGHLISSSSEQGAGIGGFSVSEESGHGHGGEAGGVLSISEGSSHGYGGGNGGLQISEGSSHDLEGGSSGSSGHGYDGGDDESLSGANQVSHGGGGGAAAAYLIAGTQSLPSNSAHDSGVTVEDDSSNGHSLGGASGYLGQGNGLGGGHLISSTLGSGAIVGQPALIIQGPGHALTGGRLVAAPIGGNNLLPDPAFLSTEVNKVPLVGHHADSTFSSTHISQGLNGGTALPDASFLSSHLNQDFAVHGQGISDSLSSSSTFTCGKNHDHNTNYHTATFQVADHDHPSSVDVLQYGGDAAVLIKSGAAPFHDHILPERKHYKASIISDAEASGSDNRNELTSQAEQLTGLPTEQEQGNTEAEQIKTDDGDEPERHSYYHEITKVTKIPANTVGSVEYTFSKYETKPQSFSTESETVQEEPEVEQPQIIRELEHLSDKFQLDLENPKKLFDDPPSQELAYHYPFQDVEGGKVEIKEEGHKGITEFPYKFYHNPNKVVQYPKKPIIKYIPRPGKPHFHQKTVSHLQPKPPLVVLRKPIPKQFIKKQNYEVHEHGGERQRPIGEIFPPQKFPKQFHNPKPNFAVDRPKNGWRPDVYQEYKYDHSHGKKVRKFKTKGKVVAPIIIRRPVSPAPVIRVVEVTG